MRKMSLPAACFFIAILALIFLPIMHAFVVTLILVVVCSANDCIYYFSKKRTSAQESVIVLEHADQTIPLVVREVRQNNA